jgi:glycosyltransferase involved in cell wall biosynthesis
MLGNASIRLLVIAHHGQLYGANKSLLDVILSLSNFNVEVSVLVNEEGDFTLKLNEKNIPYSIYSYRVPFEFRWTSKNWFFKSYHDVRHLLNSVRRLIINKRISKQIIQNGLLDNIDLIYSNTSVITIGETLCNYLQIPHIHQIRELPILLGILPDFGKSYYYKKLCASKTIIFNSQFTKDQFFSNNLTSDSVVIYNEIKKPDVSKKINSRKNTFKIGVFGYLNTQKNQLEVLEAFSAIPNKSNIELYVIGGGDITKYRAIASNLNILKFVTFTGFIENVGDYYHLMDLVIVPAVNEALGRVTIEAMLCGKAVIGKNSGATSELIREMETGLLYNSLDELVSKINFLRNNELLRNKISKEGRNFAVTRFSSGRSIEKLYTEFEKLVNEVKNSN